MAPRAEGFQGIVEIRFRYGYYIIDPVLGTQKSTVRIIARRTLREFWESHPNAEDPLLSWYRTVRHADWATPMQVKSSFPKADMVGNNRVVFNIRGNRYRLIAKIDYRHRIVFVRFVGTHADYNRIDAREV